VADRNSILSVIVQPQQLKEVHFFEDSHSPTGSKSRKKQPGKRKIEAAAMYFA